MATTPTIRARPTVIGFSPAHLIARHPLAAYVTLAFAGTWPLLVPLALGRGEHGLGLLPIAVPTGVDFLLAMVSAYSGPLLAAILVTAATDGRRGVRQFLAGIGRWRVGAGWYLVALFAPLLIWLAGSSTVLAGAPLLTLADQWSLLVTTFLPTVVLGLLLPSLGEEPGWRGFALPRLQQRFGPLAGSAILGALHGLWHLPMFFTPNLGPFTVTEFVTFIVTAVATAFLYTWVYNTTGGSILLAMLLHASGNAAASLLNRLELPLDGWAQALVDGGWVGLLAFGVTALLIIIGTRGRLAYAPERPAPATGGAGPAVAPTTNG